MPIKFVSGANPSLVIGAQFGAAQQKQYAEAERAQLLSEQRKQDEKEMFEYRLTAQQKADQARYQTALYQLDTNNDFDDFEKEEARRRIMAKMAGIQPLPMRKDPSKYPKGQGVGETWMDPHTGALVTRGTDENIKKIADDPTAISFADYAKLQAQLTKNLTVSTDPTKPPTPPDPAVVQAKMQEIMASYQQAIGSRRPPVGPAADQAGGAEAPTLPQPVGSGRKPVRGEPQGLRVDGGAFVPAQAAPQGPPPPLPPQPAPTRGAVAPEQSAGTVDTTGISSGPKQSEFLTSLEPKNLDKLIEFAAKPSFYSRGAHDELKAKAKKYTALLKSGKADTDPEVLRLYKELKPLIDELQREIATTPPAGQTSGGVMERLSAAGHDPLGYASIERFGKKGKRRR